MIRLQRLTDKYYRELFESTNEAICIHDLDGNFVAVNRACEEITGYSHDELLKKNIATLLKEDSLAQSIEVQTRLLRGETVEKRYEQQIIKRDGAEAILESTASLVLTKGKPVAIQHMSRDVTEERKMQNSLRFHLQAVLRAQEDERERIARELHDETVQALLLLAHRLDSSITNLTKKLSKSEKKELEQLHSLAVNICEGLWRYARNLRPRILDDMGLVAALEFIANELRKGEGIDVRVQVPAQVPILRSEIQLVMFRIAQEALSNVRRYAEATEVIIRLDFEEGKMRMTISDNGKGFDLPKLIGEFASTGRLGLVGMYERSQLLGGTFDIKSKLGKGTKVTIELPIENN